MSYRQAVKARKDKAQGSGLVRFMVGLLFACLAFGAGFFVRGNIDLLARLGFDTGAATSEANPGLTVSGSTYDSLSARIAEVQGIIAEQSLDTYDLNEATGKVLAATTDAVADPYLRYYDEARYAAYLKDVSGDYAGIGVLFSAYGDQAYAVDVFPESEAESKGVQPGDFVVAIDGDRGNNNNWTQAEVVKAVSRNEGDTVVLTMRRPATLDAEGGPEYTVTLTCTSDVKENVSSELIDERVGYIKLSQITQNADSLVREAVEDLIEQGAAALVLDLRDNPGGFLTQAVDVASLFVKSGVIVEIQTHDGLATRNASGSTITDVPMVVLVNEHTAGTAEVIAGALQDNNRATVLGRQTMGRGSVQSVTELSWGGALRYTSAHYLTPMGYDINDAGITPDTDVALPVDSQEDTQRTLAIEEAMALAPVPEDEEGAESTEGAEGEGGEQAGDQAADQG